MSTPSGKNVVTSTLPESTSSLGAALAVGHMPSVAEAIINHNELGNLVLQYFLDRIDQECTTLCQRKLEPISPFRKIHVDKFPTFQWKSLIEHLSSIAPTLFRLLSTISSHSDHRNKKKVDSAHYPIVKERNREVCGVQSLIFLLLYSSHVDKQIWKHINSWLINWYNTMNCYIWHTGVLTVESRWCLH